MLCQYSALFATPLRWLLLATLWAMTTLIPNLASAQARCSTGACVVADQPLLEVSATQGPILNTLFSALLPGTDVDISVLDWDGIAQADVNLELFLELLAADIGVAEPHEALDADISLLQLVDVTAQALQADGNVVAVEALNALRVPLLELENESLAGGAITGLTFPVSSLLDVNLPQGSLADVDINVLDFVTTGVQIFNYENAVATKPVGITNDSGLLDLLGLGGVVERADLQAVIVEPPGITCGPAGTEFSSSSIRLKLTLDLVDVQAGQSPAINIALAAISALLPGISIDANGEIGQVELFMDLGRSEARVAALDSGQQTAIIEAFTGVADLYLGDIDDDKFFDRRHIINPEEDLGTGVLGDFELGLTLPFLGRSTLDFGVRARSHTRGGRNAETLFFSGPFPESKRTNPAAGDVPELVANLINNLELDVQLETDGSTPIDAAYGVTEVVVDQITELLIDALNVVVADTVLPVVEVALNTVIDELILQNLGIGFGSSTFTVLGVGQVCEAYGTVYHDRNHSYSHDRGDTAAGIPLFVKAIPLDPRFPGGAVAVTVDPDTGGYQLPPLANGEYRLILDTNDDLSDRIPTLPAGWRNTEVENGTVVITVRDGLVPPQNFGIFHGLSFDGLVFNDNGAGAAASANNGSQDNGELGLADIELALFRNGEVVARGKTNPQGQFRLWLGNQQLDSDLQLCQVNRPGWTSSGGQPVDNYNLESDCIQLDAAILADYQAGNPPTLVFADIPPSLFIAPGRKVATAGSRVYFPHRFTAGTAGELSFAVTQSDNSWASRVLLDSDCNEQPDEPPIVFAPQQLNANQTSCVLLEQQIPASAQSGNRNLVKLAANFKHRNSDRHELIALNDFTLVISGAEDGQITLEKSVNKSQALPGENVTYTLNYANLTDQAIAEVVITDSLPEWTTLVSASCDEPLPEGVANCEAITGVGANGEGIRWELSDPLQPGAGGQVSFTVRLED